MRTPKIVVYSSIVGGIDKPRDDVLVFNAYDRFKDPRLNAKIYKVLPHLFIEADYSIWVDGNLTLTTNPLSLVKMLGDKEVGVFAHPHRGCLYDEAQVCITHKKDNPHVIRKQVAFYRGKNFAEGQGLGACYLIVRKHTDKVARLCEEWWAHITRFSVRDQISFPYIFRNVKYFPPQQNKNEFFARTSHENSSIRV